jgi:hypothetical protein
MKHFYLSCILSVFVVFQLVAFKVIAAKGEVHIVKNEIHSNANCDPLTIRLPLGAGFCISAGESILLEAEVDGDATFRWVSSGTGTFSSITQLNPLYTPSSQELLQGHTTFELFAINPCGQEFSAQTSVKFRDVRNANAGPDQAVCINIDNISLKGSQKNSYTNVRWSGGNGTFMPNQTTAEVIYTPTAEEKQNGSLTLTFEEVGGDCPSSFDDVVITFVPDAQITTATPVYVTEACSARLVAEGFDESRDILWTSIHPGVRGTYDSYLTTPTRATTEVRNFGANPPPSVLYRITGYSTSACGSFITHQMIRVYFSDEVKVDIQPKNPKVCFGSSATQISAIVSGGQAPYNYKWYKDGQLLTSDVSSTIEAGAGVYRVEVVDATNCSLSFDEVTVTSFSEPIQVNAGQTQLVCAEGNNTRVQLNGSVIGGDGGRWSGGLGFFIPNRDALNAVYIPTINELAQDRLVLTLSSSATSGCGVVSDLLEVTFVPSPVVNAGSNIQVCKDAIATQLNGNILNAGGGVWSTSGTGTFMPSTRSLNAYYIFSQSDLESDSIHIILTSTDNGVCNDKSSQFTITTLPPYEVNAGPDQMVCSQISQVQLNGSAAHPHGGIIWSTNGTGTFENRNSLNTNYIPSVADKVNQTVRLTLKSASAPGCEQVESSMLITFTPAPLVNAGPDQVVCSNSSIQLNGTVQNANEGTWSGGTGTFSSRTSLNAIYSPSAAEIAAGQVQLTLVASSPGCLPVSDAVVIFFIPPPTANAGPNQLACATNPTVRLAGSVTGATGGIWTGGNGTFTPNANTLNAIYIPTAAEMASRIVTLRLTTTGNGLCAAATSSMQIVYKPAPVADAGSDVQTCPESGRAYLRGTVENATSYHWRGNGGTFSPGPTDLNAIYEPTADELRAGRYTLTLMAFSDGCEPVEDEVEVVIAPSFNLRISPVGLANCAGDSIVIAGIADREPPLTYTWTTEAGHIARGSMLRYLPSSSEIERGIIRIWLNVSDKYGCSETLDTSFSIIAPALVNAGPDQVVCSGSNVQLNGTVQNANGGTWFGGTGTFSSRTSLNAIYTPSASEIAAGSVRLTLRADSPGCTPVMDEVIITITPAPTADAGTSIYVCSSNLPVRLSGNVTGATGGTWSRGNGTFLPNRNSLEAIYIPTQEEINGLFVTLILTTTGVGNCFPAINSVQIMIGPAPLMNAGEDIEACIDNPEVTLNGSAQHATVYEWKGGNGVFLQGRNTLNSRYIASPQEVAAGSVRLQLEGMSSLCEAVTDEVEIRFLPAPIVNAGPDRIVCAKSASVQLAGTITHASGGTWSGGNGTFAPNANTLSATYTPTIAEILAGEVNLRLTTTGSEHCNPVSDQVTITITPAPTAIAGPDQHHLTEVESITLRGVASNSLNTQWSSMGNGSFINAQGLIARYLPSEEDKAVGQVILILKATADNSCEYAVDSMQVTFASKIMVEADTASLHLAEELPMTALPFYGTEVQWASATSGIFLPSDTVRAVRYQLTEQDRARKMVEVTVSGRGNSPYASISSTYQFSIPVATRIVNPLVLSEFAVYPNPVRGKFTLVTSDIGTKTLELYDYAGRLHYACQVTGASGEATEVQLPATLKGLFILHIKSAGGSTYKKLVVE